MIGALARTLDNLLGRGEAAVTVPPLDGAMRPNRRLDEATIRLPLEGADGLAIVGGVLHASAGEQVFAHSPGNGWMRRHSPGAQVTAISAIGPDGLAMALSSGEIAVTGGPFDAKRYRLGDDVACITAMVVHHGRLYVASGSAQHGVDDWQRDLMERNASGSIWHIDLESGAVRRIAQGLAWPSGLDAAEDRLVVSEAWRHRLIGMALTETQDTMVLAADLPAYPGRISKGSGCYWLAGFAPRSQLVEFVLREPTYRRRMMTEVPRDFWVAPTLRSGRSFYEPLQGGGVKHLGLLKPWAPTMSAGLCVQFDEAFQPRSSLHSRADGFTHGVTSVIEHDGYIYAAARGDGVVVALPMDVVGDQL
jgi:hypothetical protein